MCAALRPTAGRAGRAGLLAPVLAATLVGTAGAQPAGTAPSPLPPVTRRLPPVVARGVEPGALPEDPSSFTTVIEVEDRRADAATVEDLLERVPGVQVRRFGGEGQPAEISIRGSSAAQVAVLLDGVRLNSAQSGRVDLSTIPLSLLERIEVSRGGGSVQVGSDAIGGVVNLVTRRPGGPTRTDVAAGGGSFGTVRGEASRSGVFRDVEYVAGWDGFRSEGDFEFRRFDVEIGDLVIEPDPPTTERINNESESQAALLGLGRALGERTRLSARNALYYGSRGQPGLDSGSVGAAGQREDAHERRLRNLATVELEHVDLGGLGIDATAGLSHRYERQRFRDPDVVPSLGDTISTDDRNRALVGSLLLDSDHRAFGLRHRGRASLELRRDALESRTLDDQRRGVFGLTVQDDAGAFGDALRLVPALRLDATEGFGAEWLPRLGAIVSPWPWLRLKANVERAYRVPNFDELYFPDQGFLRGNPALEPEESTSGDAGLELALARLGPLRDVRLEAAWFHQAIDESIVFLLVSPSLIEPRNTGPATSRGYELGAGFRLLDWIGVSAQHTRLDADLDESGAPLPGRADRETNVVVEVGPPSRAVTLVGQMQATSEIPVTDTGSTILPRRTVFDASLAVDLARLGWVPARAGLRALVVSFEGRNLSDRAVRDAQFFPQPGRSFALRVAAAW